MADTKSGGSSSGSGGKGGGGPPSDGNKGGGTPHRGSDSNTTRGPNAGQVPTNSGGPRSPGGGDKGKK
jgi:hypothetical protein